VVHAQGPGSGLGHTLQSPPRRRAETVGRQATVRGRPIDRRWPVTNGQQSNWTKSRLLGCLTRLRRVSGFRIS
jgi:hypothetical protein